MSSQVTTGQAEAIKDDQQRLASLRRMKAIATLLFVAAAAVFFVSLPRTEDAAYWGYILAVSEAAMVGAIADWFAVTALFKHPLGIPIPHTAIIRNRKDQIGASLGAFVRDNFLTRAVIEERLGSSNIAHNVGTWMTIPENSKLVVRQSSALITGVIEVLEDDKVQATIEEAVREKLESASASVLASKMLDGVTTGGHHQVMFDAVLRGLNSFLDDNAELFRNKFSQESPWWIPDLVDDRVYNKVYSAVKSFISEISDDPNHLLRADFDLKLANLRDSLDTSPEAQAAAERWKQQILDNDEVADQISSIWIRVKDALLAGTKNPESGISTAIAEAVTSTGERLLDSPELQDQVNGWISDAAVYVAEEFRGQVSSLIQGTVEGWDAKETAERLEIQVGRDLQFIRINGTLVGGLVGLIIHTVSELV